MAPNLTEIANEFGFDNIERDKKLGGDISIAFFILAAPASYIIGCLGDSYPRIPLFVSMVFLGEGACAATFWTKSYKGLYISRALTGFSLGGVLPLIYSLQGDLYPSEQRGLTSAILSVGSGIGIALGQGIAGFLGPIYGWRFPFICVSLPALLTAVLTGMFVDEPKRGSKEKVLLSTDKSEIRNIEVESQEEKDDITLSDPKDPILTANESLCYHCVSEPNDIHRTHVMNEYENRCNYKFLCISLESFHAALNILQTKTVVLLFLQGGPGCLPWGIVNAYLNDYLSEDRGMSIQKATSTILFFGVGVGIGILFGGGMSDLLYIKKASYPSILAGCSSLFACIPFTMMINTVDADTPLMLLIIESILAGLGTGVTGPIVKATLTNVTHPNERGQAFAMMNTFDDLGRGLGPFFIALLLQSFDGNRQKVYNYAILGWVLCGFCNLLIYFTVVDDEIRLFRRILTEKNKLITSYDKTEDNYVVIESDIEISSTLSHELEN